jgi:hypothetical protein
MSIFIRSRSKGRSAELRIKHKLLPKTVYFTFPSEAEAQQCGERAEAFLSRGVVPEGLVPEPRSLFTNVADAIDAYEQACAVPGSTSNVLATVSKDVGGSQLTCLDYAWADAWVTAQKLQHRRSPGTIRHHVGALARCLDWVVNRHPTYLAHNPLMRLPRGYSAYNDRDKRALRAGVKRARGPQEAPVSPPCVWQPRGRIAPGDSRGVAR